MKLIRTDDKKLELIEESDKYIDIYTYRDYRSYYNCLGGEDNWLYTDNGKGWRLNGLLRIDKETKIEYEIESDPWLCSFDGFNEFSIKYTDGENTYYRILVICHKDKQDYMGYLTQDIRNKNYTEMFDNGDIKKYRYRKIDDECGSFYVTYEKKDGYVKITETDDPVSYEGLDPRTVEYIYDDTNDFADTNRILRDFYEFSRKYYVFGRKGEEPRVVEVIGENNQTIMLKRASFEYDAKIRCEKPNKYKLVKDIKRWSI